MLMSRAITELATLLAAAIVLTGCGGGSGGGSAHNASVVRVPANLCALLSAADISQAIGRTFPAPQRTQNGLGEQDCNSVPASGNSISFKLYWGDCADGQPADQNCLNSQSKLFASNKQTAGSVQGISGLGDQAFCFNAPPAKVEVLKGWTYLTTEADNCAQAQKLAGMLLAKLA